MYVSPKDISLSRNSPDKEFLGPEMGTEPGNLNPRLLDQPVLAPG